MLNDNGMSISPNIGGLSHYLGRLRGSRKYISMKAQIKKNISKVPLIGEGMVAGMQHARDSIKYAVIDGVLFEELGFKYFGSPSTGMTCRRSAKRWNLQSRPKDRYCCTL